MKGTPLLAVLLLSAVPAAAAEMVPDVRLQISGARYAPSEITMDWDTWIGAGAGVVRFGSTTAYVSGDVETIMGGERRSFEANQSAYQLEAGTRVDFGGGSAALFFHHVSRHALDREMIPTVSWNNLGLRARHKLSLFGEPAMIGAEASVTVAQRNTGYVAEARVMAARDAGDNHAVAGYWRAEARLVRTDDVAWAARRGFIDASAEMGLRIERHGRRAEIFITGEHRNDTLPLVESARTRALMGLRFAVVTGSIDAPAKRD